MELFAILLIIAGFVFYFLPTIVAGNRETKGFAGVLIVNLLFGWTILGWIVALVWAFSDSPSDEGKRTCPFCAEKIQPAAIVCPHCQRDLPAREAGEAIPVPPGGFAM